MDETINLETGQMRLPVWVGAGLGGEEIWSRMALDEAGLRKEVNEYLLGE